MFNANSLTLPVHREYEWKRRPTGGGTAAEPLSKEPEDYQFQAVSLKNSLTKLTRQRGLVEQGVNKYLEVFFFIPKSDFSDGLRRFLEERYSLELIKISEVGGRSKVFFKIRDIASLITRLTADINTYEAFAFQSLSREDFMRQGIARIGLFWAFNLSTKDTKEQVSQSLRPCKKVRLNIEMIKENPAFDTFVTQSASQLGLRISLFGEGVLDISDLSSGTWANVAELASRLANFDDVQIIQLDDFMSAVESPLEGGQQRIMNVSIDPLPAGAPVVAVIDTGVQRHDLTNPFLMNEGLDYSNPTTPNPFIDTAGHGTKVACEIAYGKSIWDYFVSQSPTRPTSLIPVARIFPVKVDDNTESFLVDYAKIFSLTGEFAEAVERLGIRIVNISLSAIRLTDYEVHKLSEAAVHLDRFARKYKVIFVVCAGNIPREKLEELAARYTDLRFYERPPSLAEPHSWDTNKELNVTAPGDTIAGITVGSCFQQGKKFVVSSFSRCYGYAARRNPYVKPDVVSIGGGDYPIDLSSVPAQFCPTSGRVAVMTNNPSVLHLDYGTSLSTPRVSRALAIESLQYPSINSESLKCLFMHKAEKRQAMLKKRGQVIGSAGELQPHSVPFDDVFRGNGLFAAENEIEFFQDSDDESTFMFSGSVVSGRIRSFRIPMPRLPGNGTDDRHNNMRLTLSVCFFPPVSYTSFPRDLKSANPFHVSAIAHINSLSPTFTKRTPSGKVYENQCIGNEDDGVLVGWTCDYYSHFHKAFSSKSQNTLKDELTTMLGSDETVTISVRGLSEMGEGIEIPFGIVLSVEDLGATGQIRQIATVQLQSGTT